MTIDSLPLASTRFDDYDVHLAAHLPGAVFVGMIDELSDPPHPVPDTAVPPYWTVASAKPDRTEET